MAASDTLSRQFCKFAGGINAESEILVHGLIKKPFEPVKSATISHLEIHVCKLYIISESIPQLPLQVADSERAIPSEQEHEQLEEEGERPLVMLNTRLNHRVLDLRSRLNHSIFVIKDGIVALFEEYMRSHGFIGVQSPKLLGSPVSSVLGM